VNGRKGRHGFVLRETIGRRGAQSKSNFSEGVGNGKSPKQCPFWVLGAPERFVPPLPFPPTPAPAVNPR